MYLALAYGTDIDDQYSWPILKARFFEMGHSISELNAMGFEDVGVIVGYMSGRAKGEAKAAERNKRLQGGGKASTQQSKE